MSNINLAGDTSGTLTLTVPAIAGSNTITLPALTGTIITTASTSGIPNTVNWTTVQTANVNPAVAGTGYPMNTTSGALTVTLPASPTAGNLISILDYAGTFATNNLTINPNGNKIVGQTSNVILNTNREAINLVYVDSTQGWLAYADVYSTTNPINVPYTASYLVVAGGGGGAGYAYAGGGGAGGYLTGTLTFIPGTVYTATVGGGGAGSSPGVQGVNGSNSTFPGVTAAVGGGGGCTSNPTGGSSGGSGGGGGGNVSPGIKTGGAGTPGQGNTGGNGASDGSTYANGGGGGGSSAVGGTSPGSGSGGTGGAGTASSITGSSVTYAGGGGGAGTGANGPGGAGGGGAGGSPGTAGTTNTGGGGGGAGGSVSSGGNGGSGVVILSVPTANYSGTTTGSPTITTSGSNTIIKWTSGSGTYTA
jgi:hypothetical protein